MNIYIAQLKLYMHVPVINENKLIDVQPKTQFTTPNGANVKRISDTIVIPQLINNSSIALKF